MLLMSFVNFCLLNSVLSTDQCDCGQIFSGPSAPEVVCYVLRVSPTSSWRDLCQKTLLGADLDVASQKDVVRRQSFGVAGVRAHVGDRSTVEDVFALGEDCVQHFFSYQTVSHHDLQSSLD